MIGWNPSKGSDGSRHKLGKLFKVCRTNILKVFLLYFYDKHLANISQRLERLHFNFCTLATSDACIVFYRETRVCTLKFWCSWHIRNSDHENEQWSIFSYMANWSYEQCFGFSYMANCSYGQLFIRKSMNNRIVHMVNCSYGQLTMYEKIVHNLWSIDHRLEIVHKLFLAWKNS